MHDKLIANINNNSVIIVSGSRIYLKKKKITQSNMTCCKDKKNKYNLCSKNQSSSFCKCISVSLHICC